MNPEEKLFVPHGVKSVSVDGLRAEMAAVQRHAQDVSLDARTSGAVTGAHVLARDDLNGDDKGSRSQRQKRSTETTSSLSFCPQRTLQRIR